MQKPPVGFRGDTGIGALTGLKGVGQQEPFLYEEIPREPKYPEYTHATPYYRFYRPTSTRFLGEEIRHVFRPKDMGDLLTSLVVKCRFPPTSGDATCLRNLGLSMIRRADLLIDGLVVQTFRGEWMSIYESMYSSQQDREEIFNIVFNLGGTYDAGASLKANDATQTLFFPLPFFFNKHYVDSKVDTTSFRVPFPMCSIHNSEVTIVIQFRSLDEIVSSTDGFAAGADLLDFKFVTREVTLTPQERFMLMSKPQEYPIEKISTEEIEVPATVGAKFRYYFNSAYSCRAIFWTFKNKLTGYNPVFYTPIINAQVVTLNKTDRGELRKPLFFQEFQAYVHNFHNNKTFYAYSFAETPLQVVLDDYEFRAPRPQSAYIDMFFTTVSAGYELWTNQFAATQQNYTIQDNRIILNTSVGLGGESVLNSLRMISFGYFRTNTARVGIPGISYSSTTNEGDPPTIPFKMRFEPWNGSKITVGAVDYFRTGADYHLDGLNNMRNGSFYYNADEVSVPAWSNADNDKAIILFRNSSAVSATSTGGIQGQTTITVIDATGIVTGMDALNGSNISSTATVTGINSTTITMSEVNAGSITGDVIFQKRDQTPEWVVTSGSNIYSISEGTTMTVDSTLSGFSLGTGYPTSGATLSDTTATSGYIKITSDARTNINTYIPAVETFIISVYYLSTNKFVAFDGRGTVVEKDGSNGVVEGKFNRIDTDGSGFIDAIEFDVSTYDKDGDGKVSFAEFKEIEEG